MKRIVSKLLALMLISSVSAFADASVIRAGDYMTFGTYEQDNDYINGQEPIEWLVLDVDESYGAALLISRYGLDVMPFNKYQEDVTWENSTLRSWLNGAFLDEAFSAGEKQSIISTKNKAENNPNYVTKAGHDTVDEVFLLSVSEADYYFSDNAARMCPVTDFALEQGAKTKPAYSVNGVSTAWWWLRTPGHSGRRAVFVDRGGDIWNGDPGGIYGENVDSEGIVVRPALWMRY